MKVRGLFKNKYEGFLSPCSLLRIRALQSSSRFVCMRPATKKRGKFGFRCLVGQRVNEGTKPPACATHD